MSYTIPTTGTLTGLQLVQDINAGFATVPVLAAANSFSGTQTITGGAAISASLINSSAAIYGLLFTRSDLANFTSGIYNNGAGLTFQHRPTFGANIAVDAGNVGSYNSANVTGTVAVGNGGTGLPTLTANNVLLGNGTSALQAVAPSTSGNVLTSNGTTWQSTAPTGGAEPIQPITASVGSSALTCTLNPTILNFRNTPLTSGTINTRTVATAISVVVPSTATLGTVSAQQSRLVLLALDNAGTIELAVVNIAGGNNLNETTLISTTAIAAGSNSANVVYSTTARTSLPFRVVGYIESTQATAGTWVTAPTLIQGCGGQALAAMSSLGYGQTWQNVTGSRAASTTYYNTTGKPIYIAVSATTSSGVQGLIATINGVSVYGAGTNVNGGDSNFHGIIPQGASYSLANGVGSTTIINWSELR